MNAATASLPRRLLRFGAIALTGVAVALAASWTALAIWFQTADAIPVRWIAVCLYAALVIAMGALAFRRPRSALAAFAAVMVGVAIWWSSLQPSLDRDWAPDVARTVTGTIDGDVVTLDNVRDFAWTSDATAQERWVTKQYDLRRLNETDLVLSYWGIDAIAHTLVSFGFDDGQRVVFSVEIRRERSEAFSPIAGFFKVFELAFIAAEERDILYLRTNMRGEDTYLYPLALTPEASRALFVTYVNAANERASEPAWYNTLTTNCTTVIFDLVRLIEPGIPMDWRILLSGYLPGYLVEQNATVWKLPEDEVRKKAAISAKARRAGNSTAYSVAIR